MTKKIRIGTRDSQLAVWQARQVQDRLQEQGIESELIFIKSDGDLDLVTPLYEMGVEGVFTRSLDSALLNSTIDLAVHSMKDVPVRLAEGLAQAAVLPRGPVKDLLVYKGNWENEATGAVIPATEILTIATSSIRRKAQWLHRYPRHSIVPLRGNIPTRLQKLKDENWQGAIFAQAGLERIGLRPASSVELDWMLPAPAQGAILVVARANDQFVLEACSALNDESTACCVKAERDFLKALLGGCSAPISALAEIKNGILYLRGNLLSPDGKEMVEIQGDAPLESARDLGTRTAEELLAKHGTSILQKFRNA